LDSPQGKIKLVWSRLRTIPPSILRANYQINGTARHLLAQSKYLSGRDKEKLPWLIFNRPLFSRVRYLGKAIAIVWWTPRRFSLSKVLKCAICKNITVPFRPWLIHRVFFLLGCVPWIQTIRLHSYAFVFEQLIMIMISWEIMEKTVRQWTYTGWFSFECQ